MFRSKRQQEILESTESKLAKMFEEMNTEKRPDNGRTVCETECTMARIRSFSDFMYLMKVRPLQTACYYAAAVLFLLMLAAFWCTEWLLGAVFAVLFLVCARFRTTCGYSISTRAPTSWRTASARSSAWIFPRRISSR